jgi:hypothetical protein
MRNWFVYVCFLMVFISCTNQKHQKIIPRKDLISLMVDLHIADAMALNYIINEQFGGLDSTLLYNAVLEAHGYTKGQFVNTIKYYTQEPEKLIKIYDEVFTILSKQSEETKALYSSYSDAQTKSIWRSKQSRYSIKGDTVHYPVMFDFAVDTVGKFVLDAEIKITPKDKSVNPRILAYFYNPKDDIPKNRVYFDDARLLKCNNKREYTLTKECLNPDLTRMRLVIPMHDNADSMFYKEFEMDNLRVSLVKEPKRR